MTALTITPDRLNHMLSVARRCEYLAKVLFDWPDTVAREMFLIGYIHDVGYEWVHHQRDHEWVGGMLAQSLGINYSDAIRDHGDPYVEVMDDVLLLLNLADMTTSHTGQPVTLVDRCESVKERYGVESDQYIRIQDMVQRLISELNQRGLEASVL